MAAKPATLVLALLLCAAPLAAHAEPTARQRYASAMKHFDLGEYDAALLDFKEAYRLKDDPAFLYNIAQCYRLMNNQVDAVRFYRNFLRRAPNTPNREEIESRVTELQAAIEAKEAAAKAPPPPERPPEAAPAPPVVAETLVVTAKPRQPVYKKWWLWTIVGVVVAGAVVAGTVVGVERSHASSSPFNGVTF